MEGKSEQAIAFLCRGRVLSATSAPYSLFLKTGAASCISRTAPGIADSSCAVLAHAPRPLSASDKVQKQAKTKFRQGPRSSSGQFADHFDTLPSESVNLWVLRPGRRRDFLCRAVILSAVASSGTAAALTGDVAIATKNRTIAARFKWHGCRLTATGTDHRCSL